MSEYVEIEKSLRDPLNDCGHPTTLSHRLACSMSRCTSQRKNRAPGFSTRCMMQRIQNPHCAVHVQTCISCLSAKPTISR